MHTIKHKLFILFEISISAIFAWYLRQSLFYLETIFISIFLMYVYLVYCFLLLHTNLQYISTIYFFPFSLQMRLRYVLTHCYPKEFHNKYPYTSYLEKIYISLGHLQKSLCHMAQLKVHSTCLLLYFSTTESRSYTLCFPESTQSFRHALSSDSYKHSGEIFQYKMSEGIFLSLLLVFY